MSCDSIFYEVFMGKYFIGIDIGTTNIKSVLFNDEMKQVYCASRSNYTKITNDMFFEQDMNLVLEKVIETITEVVHDSGVDVNKIIAIGLSGQGEGAWLIDENGTPVQDAIIWSDTRSSDLVSALSLVDKARITTITGTEPIPCNQSMILSWLEKNNPDILNKTKYCLCSKDWVRFGLTGDISVESSDSGCSIMDLNTFKVSSEVFEILGLTPYIDLIPEIRSSSDIVGEITDYIAERTGLSKSTVVATGSLDVSCAALAFGASTSGDVFSILGTTCCTGIISTNKDNRSEGSRCIPHPISNLYFSLIATLSGTPNIDWAVQNIALTNDFSEIETLIENIGIGSGGVWYHPYLSGERAPFFNANARASFFGINRGTTRAHLLRAVYEGISYTIKDALEGQQQGNFIYLAGGGANSKTWLQIISDVTNRTVIVSTDSELSSKGAAMLAAIAVGHITDPKDPKYFEISKKVPPIKENAIKYGDYFKLYKQFQLSAHELWDLRAELRGKYKK